jgi:heme-degrading monooxygenase HmoA
VIVEHAEINVTTGREDEFVAAFPQARAVLSQADGFRWAELHRGVERTSTFLLLVGWDTLAAHVDGFRSSDLFVQWRAIIGPFFAEPPRVEHYAAVTAGVRPVEA